MAKPLISPVVVKNDMVFCSGQIYLTEEGKLLEGTIEEQTHQVMKNLQKVLESVGVTFEMLSKRQFM